MMLLTHIPALVVILPLLGALAASLLPARTAWGVAMAISVLCLAMVAALWLNLRPEAYLYYLLGGLQQLNGIELKIDSLALFMLTIIAVGAAACVLHMQRSLEGEVEESRRHLLYAAVLMAVAGFNGMAVTHDAFNLYVFLEISSLSIYALVACGKERQAVSSAFQYLLLGTVGATFILIGIGLIYITTGTLNMDLMAAGLKDKPLRPLLAAYGFIAAGSMLKMGLFPLHYWLPSAYRHSPGTVTAFMAGMATKLSAYAMMRLLYTLHGTASLGPLLVLCGVLAVLAGSVLALRQNDLKRMLAFSSIAQMGYIAIGIGLATPLALIAVISQMLAHALAKTTLFLCVANMSFRLGKPATLENTRGLATTMPYSAMGFTLAMLALVGLPLTAGFIAKWHLIAAAMTAPLWLAIPLLLVVVAGSVLALAYGWKTIESLYAKSSKIKEDDAPLVMLLPVGALVAGLFYAGLNTQFLPWAATASLMLLKGYVP
jgi:multicomponent Na+:H+ antiporter subunit D